MTTSSRDYMFAIKDKNGLYLANPIWHLRWTTTLIRAQFFLKREQAEQALIKRAGEVVLIEVREVDLTDVVEVEMLQEAVSDLRHEQGVKNDNNTD